MNKPLFACDIDNTLIYSHRHPHDGWPCVEWREGREQAYMSPASIAQYRRLALPVELGMVVTGNGADLLIGGAPDTDWRAETDALLAPWRAALQQCRDALAASSVRWRDVDGACLAISRGEGDGAEALAAALARRTALDAITSGRKVYLLPPPLDKGRAIDRLMRRLGCARCVAAGDSVLDLPMLRRADAPIAPRELSDRLPDAARLCPPERLFSEFALESALAICRGAD